MHIRALTPWCARNRYWVENWSLGEAYVRCLDCGETRRLTAKHILTDDIHCPCRHIARRITKVIEHCVNPDNDLELRAVPTKESPAWIRCSICGHQWIVSVTTSVQPSKLRCARCHARKRNNHVDPT